MFPILHNGHGDAPKLAHFLGGPDPQLIRRSFGPSKSTSQTESRLFRRFSTGLSPTDTETHRPHYVCSNSRTFAFRACDAAY